MDPQHQFVHSLQRQALLSHVSQQMEKTRHLLLVENTALIDGEAKHQSKLQMIERFQEDLRVLEEEKNALDLQVRDQQVKVQLVQNQYAMMKDLSGFLKGELFQDSEKGAEFFTHSLKDFAHVLGVGPLSVEAMIGQSRDGFHITYQDRKYVFLKGRGDAYYFHPASVDLDQLLHLSSIHDV